MVISRKDKIYVVYRGYRPGIYLSWPNAFVQVNGFKGNLYLGFRTYEEAEADWIQYCIDHGLGEAQMQSGLCPYKQQGGSTSNETIYILFDIGSTSQHYPHKQYQTVNTTPHTFAEDISGQEFVIQHSMQKELQHLCQVLRIPQPEYTLHEMRIIHGVEYFQYYASLKTGVIGSPSHSVGSFAKDDYAAQEDVAASLICRLLAATRTNIRDLNYYNVVILEEQLKKTMEENLELHMEIVALNEELRLVSEDRKLASTEGGT